MIHNYDTYININIQTIRMKKLHSASILLRVSCSAHSSGIHFYFTWKNKGKTVIEYKILEILNIKYFSVKHNLQKSDFAFPCIFLTMHHLMIETSWALCKIPDIFRKFSAIFVLLMYERPLVVTICLHKWCF